MKNINHFRAVTGLLQILSVNQQNQSIKSKKQDVE